MTVILTAEGYDRLSQELLKLVNVDSKIISQELEETRPIGVSDEFPPEYLQAIDKQNRLEKRISDLNELLCHGMILNKNMIKTDNNGNMKVGVGSKVTFMNIETEEEKTYTVVSPYESDISKGLISYESPFYKEMRDSIVGETFEINNNEYEIIKIDFLI